MNAPPRSLDAGRATARPLRVIIGGGWTGGHLFTALAIAEALRRRDPATQILLVGARGGMEVALARETGLPMKTVWLDGIARGRSARAFARNLTLPIKLGVATLQAWRILDRFRPDVVVGVGAYVSFPVVAVAAWMGVPTLLHEANVVPGVANAWLARRADVICVGHAEAASHFAPNVGPPSRPLGTTGLFTVRGSAGSRARVVHTGNPVRLELAGARAADPREARLRLGVDPSKQTLLVIGGSLGSARLNEWMLAEGRGVLDGADRQIVWQCGRAHLAACRARGGGGDDAGVCLIPFLDDMPAAYAAADLVVASAGAATIAELAALGKAAVVVPDPGVSEDHQARNGDVLRAHGVAVWEDALDRVFTARVRALLDDPAALRALGANIARLDRPQAADAVAAEIAALRN